MRYNSFKCIFSSKIINILAPTILQDPLMTLYDYLLVSEMFRLQPHHGRAWAKELVKSVSQAPRCMSAAALPQPITAPDVEVTEL